MRASREVRATTLVVYLCKSRSDRGNKTILQLGRTSLPMKAIRVFSYKDVPAVNRMQTVEGLYLIRLQVKTISFLMDNISRIIKVGGGLVCCVESILIMSEKASFENRLRQAVT